MKNLIVSIIIFLMLFASCSNNNNITSPSDSSSGSVSLSIDKANAPSDVVAVIAYLTREYYETLSGYLNLISDSTADISFQSIPIGTWHIKVDAINKDSVVIYSGESDVVVHENILTQISLALLPTSNGSSTGSVYIYVTWGSNTWVDYSNNPILSTTNSYWDIYGPNQPKVLYDEGIYHMWFGNLVNGGGSYVGYAYSYDGKSWIRKVSYPVLTPGSNDKWDYGRAGVGPVIKKDGEFVMYYNGWGDQNGLWQVGMAVSNDGINWEKYPNPILSGDLNGDDARINANCIMKLGNQYFMYYTYGPSNGVNYKIGLAFSGDGINWEKYQNNPILDASLNWEGAGIGNASVINTSTIN